MFCSHGLGVEERSLNLEWSFWNGGWGYLQSGVNSNPYWMSFSSFCPQESLGGCGGGRPVSDLSSPPAGGQGWPSLQPLTPLPEKNKPQSQLKKAGKAGWGRGSVLPLTLRAGARVRKLECADKGDSGNAVLTGSASRSVSGTLAFNTPWWLPEEGE